MKIRIDKDVVSFTPEHAAEAAELEALWIKLGNCVGNTKNLQPIGTYLPSENKTAQFHIEGLNDQELAERDKLRRIYIDSVKASLVGQLENTYIVEPYGTKRKLGQK